MEEEGCLSNLLLNNKVSPNLVDNSIYYLTAFAGQQSVRDLAGSLVGCNQGLGRGKSLLSRIPWGRMGFLAPSGGISRIHLTGCWTGGPQLCVGCLGWG